MKVVTAYETDDGTLFESKAAAEEHERALRRLGSMADWADEHLYSGMSSSEVMDVILETREQLLRILT